MISVKAHYNKATDMIHFDSKDKPELREYKHKLADGVELEITIKLWADNKTGRQNRLFHALLSRYCSSLGLDFDETKMRLKYKYGGWITAEEALRDKPSWNGRFLEVDGVIVFVKSWADYNITEGKIAIDGLIKDCITAQVKIDDIIKEFDIV